MGSEYIDPILLDRVSAGLSASYDGNSADSGQRGNLCPYKDTSDLANLTLVKTMRDNPVTGYACATPHLDHKISRIII